MTTLTARCSPSHDGFVVNYCLVNHEPEPVYVFNVLEGRFWRDPLMASYGDTLAFTFCDDDHSVRLWQGQAPSPAYGSEFPSLAKRVEPGEELRARIVLPSPLIEWHAHLAPNRQRSKRIGARSMDLWIQTMAASDTLYVDTFDAALGEPVHNALGERSWFARAQVELASPVPVFQRTDAIDRFDLTRIAPVGRAA